jgi:DNA adenine methylase
MNLATVAPSRPPLDPLFRWPGGKRWLVPALLDLVPQSLGTYYEPFFGGGALFFALTPGDAVISDANSELMDAYRAIQKSASAVERLLASYGRDRAAYIAIRTSHPIDAYERAARLVYLTTMAFNGIYRVNKRGQFNVPFGGREYLSLGSPGSLEPYARALNTAEITSGDFEVVLSTAKSGDFAYLDPPYTVAHSNNGFLRYNERIFSWKDQQRLASVATELDRRGCLVVVSNAAHSSVRTLYSRLGVFPVSRRSLIAADSTHRKPIDELVFTNAR